MQKLVATKSNRLFFTAPLCIAASLTLTLFSQAATLYVSPSSANPAPPFNAWTNAAQDIQTAVNATQNGDTVIVTNGIYYTSAVPYGGMTNRVVITNSITLKSVNGPNFTTIKGQLAIAGLAPVTCVYMATNATLTGFTMKGGQNYGVYCSTTNCTITNCVITGCSGNGTGAANGSAAIFAGAVFNSLIISNQSTGVAYSTCHNCVINFNAAGTSVGCTGGGAYSSVLYNCLLTGNTAAQGGGAGGGTMYNCTVTANTGGLGGGGGGGGCYGGTFDNCIVYGNYSLTGTSSNYDLTRGVFTYCCCAPVPSGLSNISANPQFVSAAIGNCHLLPTSPCLGNGDLEAWQQNAVDLDGNPRVQNFLVDMGCYELAVAGGIPNWWLSQYGLPTDGSMNNTSLSGDGRTVKQYYIADANPTNAASYPALTAIQNGTNAMQLTWQGGVLATQFLDTVQTMTNANWQTIFTNTPPTPASNNFTQSGATNGAGFYRLRMQR